MELATPINIYWDFPAGTADTDLLAQVCNDVIACRPLMVHLHNPGPDMGQGVIMALERLKRKTIAVSLTTPSTALDETARPLLPRFGLSEILLAMTSMDRFAEEMTSLQHFSHCAGNRDGDKATSGAGRPAAGISFKVTRENWRELPTLIARCREEQITRLVLPMQRLYSGEIPFALNSGEQQVLADSLAATGGTAGMTLTIHDPFLWRAFNPGAPFPQGGCQAANTMLAIAPDRVVYACPALPVRLGELGQISLNDIAASSAKQELRRKLAATPHNCRCCPALAECRGGCRGRAYVTHGSLDGADGACA